MYKCVQSLTVVLVAITAFSRTGIGQETGVVADSANETRPLQAGQPVPSVSIQDASGETVTLQSLYQNQPIVLVFFRGGWCPICTKHTQELIKIYPQITSLGAEVVGISPDSPLSSKGNVTKNSIPFPILSDAEVRAAKAFGIAFQVDQATVVRYKGFGIDLARASGFSHHALPIPAVYIVDTKGKIVYSHSDPNYRERLDVKTIVEELGKLR